MVRRWFGRKKQSDDPSLGDARKEQSDDQRHDDPSLGDARRFSYRSLQLATNNFSDDRLIGEGGYARVYRGVLPNGTVIAVKYYRAFSRHGRKLNPLLISRMVKIISRIRHPNIHQIIGYCIHGIKWILVSEYVDKGSLYHLLHNHWKPIPFSWPMRVAVCIGIARGLTHLHEDVDPGVVHRDIKPANILLDANFTPKISDFDLVSFFPSSTSNDDDELPFEADEELPFEADKELPLEAYDELHLPDHLRADPFTRMVGTPAYIDPEYLRTGRVTQKSDVYLFGVTMLEIISGRKAVYQTNNSHYHHLTTWALNLVRLNRVLDIIDPVLTHFPTAVAKRFIEVAFMCTKRELKQRPSMREVTQMLEGNSPHYYSAGNELSSLATNLISCAKLSQVHMKRIFLHVVCLASSFRSSISQTNDEGGGETEPAVSEVIVPSYQIFQCDAATVSQQLPVHHHHQQQQLGVVVLSGTGDLVERLSQTMVFTRSAQLDFPEAVFPPFHARGFGRAGSRNLYTF